MGIYVDVRFGMNKAETKTLSRPLRFPASASMLMFTDASEMVARVCMRNHTLLFVPCKLEAVQSLAMKCLAA